MRSKQDQTSVKMDNPEAPAVDIEGGDSTNTTNGQSEVKRKKASTRSHTLIGILITIVVIFAIFGIVVAVHPEILKRKEDFTPNPPTDPPTDRPTGSPSEPSSEFPLESDDTFREGVIHGDPITEDPFEVEASLFSSDVTEPYNSIEELRKNIEALAKIYANSIILEEANMYNYNYGYDMAKSEVAMVPEMAMEDASTSSSVSSSGFFGGVDDFQTYQHEVGVVKNDMVKSNGEYVFTAADNRIEVWDLEGNLFEGSTVSSAGPDGNSIYIQALLLNPEGSKLIVIASDYGMYTKSLDISVIDNPLQTQVTIFDIEGGSLSEISQTHVDGYHVDSYSVGNNVHVVTRMMFNTWNFFGENLWRYPSFDGLTNEEYVAEATKKAQQIIPNFVDKVIDLVTEDDDIVLSRVIGIPNSINDFRSITQVNSFDTSKIGDNAGVKLHVSKSLVLQAGNTGYVYATDDWIWVSDENFAWSLEEEDYVRQTVLLGFRLDGASSKFSVVGTFPGQLLSQFSIDFVTDDDKEYVRVAVTQNFFQSGWWGPRPMPMPQPIPEPLPEVVGSRPIFDDSLNFEDQDENESRTLNEIVIFEIPTVEGDIQEYSKLVKLSSIKLGKKDETITAVRFFDNISYVVTFERTDPFYALDLSDPMNPIILGELEIPGFSQFMHPIKEDNSMLLTVGQDADENGFVTGFQVSIFDSSNPSDPKLVDRLVLGNGGTSSESSWDERAFRYIQVGEVGRLIIPLYSSTYDRFGGAAKILDGFTVFGIDLNKTEKLITREIDIDHWSDPYDSRGCYCNQVWLPTRSMVFGGNLMTLKNSNVINTNLDSEETQWKLTFQETECCLP